MTIRRLTTFALTGALGLTWGIAEVSAEAASS